MRPFALALFAPLVLAGCVGMLHTGLAFPFTLTAHMLLSWMVYVAHTADALPWSSTVVAAFPAWVAALLYLPLTGFAGFLYYRNVSRQRSS